MAAVGADHVVRSRDRKQIPDVDVYNYMLRGMQEADGQTLALVNTETGYSLTYTDVLVQSCNLAYILHKLGFRRHDVMAIYCHNCPQYMVAALAVWRLAGCLAPIDKLLVKDEFRRNVHLVRPKFIVTSKELAPIVCEVTDSSTIQVVITLDPYPGCLSWSEVTEVHDPEMTLPDLCVEQPAVATALIVSSSGTTGLPKGVELTHTNLITTMVIRSEYVIRYHGSSTVIYQPFSHLYGLLFTTTALFVRCTVYTMPSFNLKTYIDIVSQHRMRELYLVPSVAVMLAKTPLLEEYDLSHVTGVHCTTAPLKPQVEQQLARHLASNVVMRQGYGLTETSGVVVMTPYDGRAPQGSVGAPICNTQLKVIDVGSHLLPANQVGELCVRGPHVMKSYYGNPGATRDTKDDAGWLRTGDLGYYDPEGYVYIVGRLKELIKYSGYQVAPAELEGVLLQHPDVADAAVVGLPDPIRGELPLAWVVRKPNTAPSAADVANFVAEKVAPYKKLRGGVKFVDSIPRSATGKILRRLITDAMATGTKSRL